MVHNLKVIDLTSTKHPEHQLFAQLARSRRLEQAMTELSTQIVTYRASRLPGYGASSDIAAVRFASNAEHARALVEVRLSAIRMHMYN
jgi:hypothetical protein